MGAINKPWITLAQRFNALLPLTGFYDFLLRNLTKQYYNLVIYQKNHRECVLLKNSDQIVQDFSHESWKVTLNDSYGLVTSHNHTHC